MSKEKDRLGYELLNTLSEVKTLVFGLKGRTIEQVYNESFLPGSQLRRALNYLRHKGLVRWKDKDGTRFITLTKQGKVKTLLHKFDIIQPEVWDGKWRVVVFDIPESVDYLRSSLVYQLRELSFIKLQASVYIGPFAFNKAAMDYFTTSGLLRYIRLLTVESLDDDDDLRRRFNV